MSEQPILISTSKGHLYSASDNFAEAQVLLTAQSPETHSSSLELNTGLADLRSLLPHPEALSYIQPQLEPIQAELSHHNIRYLTTVNFPLRDRQTFFVKDQVVNILGFVSHMVFIATTLLC